MDRLSRAAYFVMIMCALTVLAYSTTEKRGNDELVASIAESIIRFHVRANSDSDADQALKIKVKDALVEYMAELTGDADGKAEVRQVLYENLGSIKEKASEVIKNSGESYNVEAYFENAYFPVKTYGDMVFPAGEYEALRVDIGSAEGKNWWCVIYPKLCFLDSACQVVPDESKAELEEILDEDEFSLISGKKKVYKSWIAKFFESLWK